MAVTPAVRMRGVRKSFGPVEVLHGVDFEVMPGEIRGLAGANGAGKSTMMKILNGVYRMDAGEIEVAGAKADYRGLAEARAAGLAMVFQEFSLVPTMTVAQNVFLGQEPALAGAWVDDARCREETARLLGILGSRVDPGAALSGLPVGDQQIVEIAKALSRNPRVLILDEPTASLSHAEIDSLFSVLRRLKEAGTAMVVITHHLKEILAVCDTVTVLRDGRVGLSKEVPGTTLQEIIEAMVGGKAERAPRERGPAGPDSGPREAALEVRGLSVAGKVDGVSFRLAKGEVLGIAGNLGSGRTELLGAVYGTRTASSGEILAAGKPIRPRHPADARRAGIGLVPESRKKDGIVAIHSVMENILLPVWKDLCRGFLVDLRRGRELAASLAARFRIRSAGLSQAVGTLSGGNQQKAVFAKAVAGRPSVLLLDEPTVGVDVAAKAEIARSVEELAREGTAVVVVSSEFEELEMLCDRVLVLRKGRVVAELDRSRGDSITEASLLAASQA